MTVWDDKRVSGSAARCQKRRAVLQVILGRTSSDERAVLRFHAVTAHFGRGGGLVGSREVIYIYDLWES
jgi:hypothetical protein